jgi:hypothetical protein
MYPNPRRHPFGNGNLIMENVERTLCVQTPALSIFPIGWGRGTAPALDAISLPQIKASPPKKRSGGSGIDRNGA